MAHDPEKGWKREEGGLPPPALAVPGRTRFSQPNRMKVRWEKLKRRIGNGSAPDDSLGDPTTETSDTESALVRTRTGSRSAFSEKDDGFVDTVVVENEGRYCQWKEGQVKASTTGASDPMGTEQTPPTFSGGLYHPSDFASSRNTAFHNAGALGRAYDFVRWYIWPRVHHFLFVCPLLCYKNRARAEPRVAAPIPRRSARRCLLEGTVVAAEEHSHLWWCVFDPQLGPRHGPAAQALEPLQQDHLVRRRSCAHTSNCTDGGL